MQAIIVKAFGPTATRAAKIKAKCNAGSITMSRHATIDGVDLDSQNLDVAMIAVAKKLCEKLNWPGKWIGATLPGGNDMVFVAQDGHDYETFTVAANKEAA